MRLCWGMAKVAYNHNNQFVIISEHLKVLQSGLINSCLLKLSQYQSVTVLLSSGNPNSNCISLMTRGGRKSQVRECLGFFWFMGQWGPKISCNKTQNLSNTPISSADDFLHKPHLEMVVLVRPLLGGLWHRGGRVLVRLYPLLLGPRRPTPAPRLRGPPLLPVPPLAVLFALCNE